MQHVAASVAATHGFEAHGVSHAPANRLDPPTSAQNASGSATDEHIAAGTMQIKIRNDP